MVLEGPKPVEDAILFFFCERLIVPQVGFIHSAAVLPNGEGIDRLEKYNSKSVIPLCQVDLGCHPVRIPEILPVHLLVIYRHHVECGLLIARVVGVETSLIDFDKAIQNDKTLPGLSRFDCLIANDLDDLLVVGDEAIQAEVVRIRLRVKGVFRADRLCKPGVYGVAAGSLRHLATTEPGIIFVGIIRTIVHDFLVFVVRVGHATHTCLVIIA